MPRRSSGGRPAPRAAARPTPVKNPPQQASPAPAPAPLQGGSAPGGIGSMVAEGLAWGAGSSMGHRVVDAVMGPRTVHVETAVPSAPAVAAAPVSGPVGFDACNAQSKAFQDCINNYGSDIGKCQFYIEMLNECRQGSGTTVRV